MDTKRLTTPDINHMLKCEPSFRGVFPLDLIPKRVALPASLIINTDPSTKPGQHWVAVWIDEDGDGEYFDSLGLPPLHNEIYTFIYENGAKWKFSNQPIQPWIKSSQACGRYCVLFILARSAGWSFRDFQNMFTSNLRLNDRLASGLVTLHELYEKLVHHRN